MSRSANRDLVYMREYRQKKKQACNPSSPHECSILGLADDPREYYEERAAVLEFDQGMTREEAEGEAWQRMVEKFGMNALGDI